MNSIARDIRSLGHLAATHELLARGHTPSGLRSAVHNGGIIRIRKGWYALPDLAEPHQRAARVGGRLTCVSAAIALGLWVPYSHGLVHVAVRPEACQLRSGDDHHRRLVDVRHPRVVVHWTDAGRTGRRARVNSTDPGTHGDRLAVSAPAAIEELCRCQPSEFAFVVCESALHERAITRHEFETILGRLPAKTRGALLRAGAESGSGTESTFSFRMRRLGIGFRQQVQLGRDRVDFVIGERLVVEIDSREHHDTTANAVRDARLGILGYRVLRFVYSQVMGNWRSVRLAVQAAIERGDHLVPARG